MNYLTDILFPVFRDITNKYWLLDSINTEKLCPSVGQCYPWALVLGQHYTTSEHNFSVLTSAPVSICILLYWYARHYPKTTATVVADTPELARLTQNTKLQSQVIIIIIIIIIRARTWCCKVVGSCEVWFPTSSQLGPRTWMLRWPTM